MRFGYWLAIIIAVAGLQFSTIVRAQERSAVRHDFDASRFEQGAKILVFRPRIRVGEKSTGGMFEPRADWNELARDNIERALQQQIQLYQGTLIAAPVAYGDEARLVEEYQALFGAVAESVVNYQFFVGNRLETKKADNRQDVFDWSLGAGVSQLPGAAEADFALFINSEDHFGSTGRKVLQIFGALAGVSVQPGLHAGAAALVDIKTGDLVWINADFAMGGDVREADGAQRRVGQLFEEFPLSAVSEGPQQ